ncbi:MAG TPA: ATP-binding protein [Clostridia bacterium]|nr:ATP-binding protein [Clostridia bacterium]
MDWLANPVTVRAAAVLFFAAVAFVGGAWLMRRVRRELTGDTELRSRTVGESAFALETYNGVIQRLKEQEQELRRLREEASAKASATENVSAAVLSNLASGVVLFNTAGMVQQANEAGKRILGYASPIGLHARDVFRGVTALRMFSADAETDAAPLIHALEDAQSESNGLESFRRAEMDYTTPAGDVRVLGVTLSPVKTGGGQRLGVACLVSDLTEITQLARQMRTKESLAALGEMSAGIAHEFKNSLATISGYAQMLAQGEAGTARDFGERIARETQTLNRVVMDFLQFARPGEMRNVTVELVPVLQDCATEAGVALDCDVSLDVALRGDRTALRQAFSNLLRNSAEAAYNGQAICVSVRAQSRGEMLEIELKDNGKGIDPKDVGKVFIPFYTTKAQGTGLGLALVHRIVSEHGGSVRVSSDESGTTFTLLLPMANGTGNGNESR